MSSDESRSPRDRHDGYTGVVAQQGRVIVDRDFNALRDVIDHRVEADALDIVGPCGTPDDGFAISLVETSPPSAFSPPAGDFLDFLIAPGTMYLGGERVVFPPRPAGLPITYSYFDQPDWLSPPEPAQLRFAASELVYLHLSELEVSAVEDSDLLDAALGGVDTTQRLRLLRRVRRRPAGTGDCAAAWQQAAAAWLAGGQLLDPQSMALVPQARLQVGFVQPAGFVDPCDPVAAGGYLGAENQLIRVQIALADSSNLSAGHVLVWGYDNASFMYRVAAVKTGGTMLQLTRDPPDAFHIPGTGQVIEILRTAVILETDPDTTDPLHQRSIVRCIAEPTGVLARLAQPYGPAQSGDTTNFLVLDKPLPDEYLSDPNPLFVRVWQAALPIAATGGTIELTDPATQTTTGIEVTVSVPPNEALTPGIYWAITVRPSTPQAVYPERLLLAPQPPDGPRQWVCALAVIDWRRAVVQDCRSHFDNLVTLTRRKGGCCVISISPEDVAQDRSLQSIIDRAAQAAPSVRVCLGPGNYSTAQPVRLTSIHSGMTIEGCAGNVTISAAANAAPAAFADGLLVVNGADNVTLRDLILEPAAVPLAQVIEQQVVPFLLAEWSAWMGTTVANEVLADIVAMIGVRVVDAAHFSAEQCAFRFARPLAPLSTDIFGAGILLQGTTPGVTIRECRFDSDLPSTLTPKLAPQLAARGAAAAPATSHAAALLSSVAATPSTLVQRVGGVLAQAPIVIGLPPRLGPIRQPLVVTVGCLASATLLPLQLSVLDDVTLCGNLFNNLTWAVYGLVEAKTVRIENNTVTQCSGGLWLQGTFSITPSGTVPTGQGTGTLYSQAYDAATGFQEWIVIFTLPLVYPLTGHDTAPPQPIATTPAPFSVFMTNNQIEATLTAQLSSPPSQGASTVNLGSAGVVIFANRPAVANEDTTISLVIANNRLRSANSAAPTVFVTVPDNQQRCVLSTNLAFNEFFLGVVGAREVHGPSLQILPNTSVDVGLFSVVGNAFQGRTNLDLLTRSDGQTAVGSTWVPFNSILL
jgi:Family of unknown function (DUF6519)